MPKVIDDILGSEIPVRIRSNHALEHATLHVLQQKGIKTQMGGISDVGGFWIYGEAPTDTILSAAREGLKRLAEGEDQLAVHPNCGTNIAVSSLAAGGLAWFGMAGTRGKFGKTLRRLPVAVLLGVIGYQLAKPLGPKLQKQVTTKADVAGMEIVEIVKHTFAGYTVHRVTTRMTG